VVTGARFSLITLDYSYQAFPSFTSFTREEQEDETLTQELRLVSTSTGPLGWIVGGFYNKKGNGLIEQGVHAGIRSVRRRQLRRRRPASGQPRVLQRQSGRSGGKRGVRRVELSAHRCPAGDRRRAGTDTSSKPKRRPIFRCSRPCSADARRIRSCWIFPREVRTTTARSSNSTRRTPTRKAEHRRKERVAGEVGTNAARSDHFLNAITQSTLRHSTGDAPEGAFAR